MLGLLPFPEEHRRDGEKRIRKNIMVHYISLPQLLLKTWKNFFLGYLLTALYVYPKALKKVRDVNPDVIMLNYASAYTGLLGLLVGKTLRRKVVVDFNDIVADYTSDLFVKSVEHRGKKTYGILKQAVQNLLTVIQNWIVAKADLALALTTFTLEYAKRIRNKRIFLIPDGVDTSVFNPEKFDTSVKSELKRKYDVTESEKLVMYIGRMDKWAGVELILKCAERLEQAPLKFLLIGEGGIQQDCQTSNVIFSGRIPYDLVPLHLAAADLVLVPMEPSVLGNSASPLKLFEAMAMMKPLIASNTKGISDVLDDGKDGLLLPHDETIWSSAIMNVLQEDSKESGLGKNAREKVEAKFDWNVLAGQLNTLLAQLLCAE